MAQEAGMFDFTDVIETLNEKMVRRHPHVFGDDAFATPSEVLGNWEKLKAKEREDKIKHDDSVLAGVALPLPALSRAEKLSKRAARVGFDWANTDDVFAKLEEEIAETHEAIAENDTDHIEEEIGDVLFVLVNLARKLKVDPEKALRGANTKFERRFRAVEQSLKSEGRSPKDASLDEMESLWIDAKRAERGEV
jgi:MazG family protein